MKTKNNLICYILSIIATIILLCFVLSNSYSLDKETKNIKPSEDSTDEVLPTDDNKVLIKKLKELGTDYKAQVGLLLDALIKEKEDHKKTLEREKAKAEECNKLRNELIKKNNENSELKAEIAKYLNEQNKFLNGLKRWTAVNVSLEYGLYSGFGSRIQLGFKPVDFLNIYAGANLFIHHQEFIFGVAFYY